MREPVAFLLLGFTAYGALAFIGGVVGLFRRVNGAAHAQAEARAAAASRAHAVAGARTGDTTVVVGSGVHNDPAVGDLRSAAATQFFGAGEHDLDHQYVHELDHDAAVDDHDAAIGPGAAALGPGERPGHDAGAVLGRGHDRALLRRRVPADRGPVVSDR